MWPFWTGWHVYNVHCTVYIVQCTLHSVHCTVYIVQCAVSEVKCTLQKVAFLSSLLTQCLASGAAWWLVPARSSPDIFSDWQWRQIGRTSYVSVNEDNIRFVFVCLYIWLPFVPLTIGPSSARIVDLSTLVFHNRECPCDLLTLWFIQIAVDFCLPAQGQNYWHQNVFSRESSSPYSHQGHWMWRETLGGDIEV